MLETLNQTKYKVIGVVILCVVSYTTGRYTGQKPGIETHETVVQQVKQQTDKDTHKVTQVTKKPDGTVTTVVTEDTSSKVDTNKNTNLNFDEKITPPKTNLTNVSLLAGYDFGRGPAYGASVTHQFLGPLTIGAFGLTDGIVGVSLGVNF